jgi:S-formylglutathione hydrolase FrmB
MAYLELHFFSYSLGMDISAQVLLPEKRQKKPEANFDKKYPVLYLLHGHSDDDTCFIRKSIIEILAREHDLIVVMPNVHRSFYANGINGFKYYDFIVDELPVIVGNLFHASDKREDRFIAGISMGGYGALKIALNNPDKYMSAASMSGAINPIILSGGKEKPLKGAEFADDMQQNLQNIFGDPENFYNSTNDLVYLIRQLDKKTSAKPALYQCCGSEDFLIQQNRDFNDLIKKEITSIRHTYKEMPGIHNWFYWNKALPDVLEFFGFSGEERLT